MQASDYERYNRQLILPQFGEESQQKLLDAKVLVIGAGGLGCLVLQYLTAAGVGTIGIADDDVVSLSNLHRQILYTTSDVGKPKAQLAAEKLKALNPSITFYVFDERLVNTNALDIVSQFNIIADGTDNFATRYMINDACVLLQKPLVSASISRYEGQVAVFNVLSPDRLSVNYRDLFPSPPSQTFNCSEAGVLGVLPGIAGSLQANEVIKLITGLGQPLVNRLLTFNALNNNFYELVISRSEEGRKLLPTNVETFLNMDYEVHCSTEEEHVEEINMQQFEKLKQHDNIVLIDVRELNEHPTIEDEHLRIPLSGLRNNIPSVDTNTIVTICHMGIRSIEAAKILQQAYGTSKHIVSLEGGILSWQKHLYKKQTHA